MRARFHQKAPARQYLTKREAEILLSAIDKQVVSTTNEEEESLPDRGAVREAVGEVAVETRRQILAPTLAARDHAAFSVMMYAGLRIEETTSLTVEDVSFTRGEEEIRVSRGKGNKERVVPMVSEAKEVSETLPEGPGRDVGSWS